MKICILLNPAAGHNRGRKIVEQVEKAARDLQLDYRLELTEYPGHARQITAEMDFAQIDGLVGVGGDGTLFEIVNGYYRNPSRGKIPLGILPGGTGNAFIRDMGIRGQDWHRALEIVAAGNIKKVDVGYFTSPTEDYYFLNILGFGFVADVSKTAHKLKVVGNLAYSLGVFYELLRLNSYRLKFELDGRIEERDNIFVEISNTRYTGATFLMAPEARIDDGLLNITLLNKCTRRRILKLFPTIFEGTHGRHPEVETFTASKIKFSPDRAKVLTPDGEVLGSTPIEVTCLKEDLPVFWPES